MSTHSAPTVQQPAEQNPPARSVASLDQASMDEENNALRQQNQALQEQLEEQARELEELRTAVKLLVENGRYEEWLWERKLMGKLFLTCSMQSRGLADGPLRRWR